MNRRRHAAPEPAVLASTAGSGAARSINAAPGAASSTKSAARVRGPELRRLREQLGDAEAVARALNLSSRTIERYEARTGPVHHWYALQGLLCRMKHPR